MSLLKRKSEGSDDESCHKKGKHQAPNDHDSDQRVNESQSKRKYEVMSDDESPGNRKKKQKEPEEFAYDSASSRESTPAPSTGPLSRKRQREDDNEPPKAKRSVRESTTINPSERKKYHEQMRNCLTLKACKKLLSDIPKRELLTIALAFNDAKEEDRLMLAKRIGKTYIPRIVEILVQVKLDRAQHDPYSLFPSIALSGDDLDCKCNICGNPFQQFENMNPKPCGGCYFHTKCLRDELLDNKCPLYAKCKCH